MMAVPVQPTYRPLYKYQALHDKDIRLIDICPAESPAESIRCRLRHVTLDPDTACPEPYATMSYAWGKTYEDGSHLTDSICCDGAILMITSNLHGALKRIRQKMDSGEVASTVRQHVDSRVSNVDRPSLWADAICVNQMDLDERSRQVQRMAKIYEASSLLLIWLGDFTPEFHTSYLREILEHSGPIIGAIRFLRRCEWFSRRWVIQEIRSVHPSKRCVLIGDCLIRVSDFMPLLWSAVVGGLDSGALDDTVSPPTSMPQELHYHAGARCSDARDCVYALMHLCRDIATLPVSYTDSVEQVYYAAAVQSINTSFSKDKTILMMLVCSGIRRGIVRRKGLDDSADLPTWVPDWRITINSGLRAMGCRAIDWILTGSGEDETMQFPSASPPTPAVLKDRFLELNTVILDADTHTVASDMQTLECNYLNRLASRAQAEHAVLIVREGLTRSEPFLLTFEVTEVRSSALAAGPRIFRLAGCSVHLIGYIASSQLALLIQIWDSASERVRIS